MKSREQILKISQLKAKRKVQRDVFIKEFDRLSFQFSLEDLDKIRR